MASLEEDIKDSANWLVKAFRAIGKELDFSAKSVIHIETVLTEQFENGQPKPDGLFASGLGGKLFAISSYVGEVIIRNTKATKWVTNDEDPQGEINIRIVSANGTEMFPAHRVMKRLHNGEEDNIYHYTVLAIQEYMNFEGEVPLAFRDKIENIKKPWWKFW